MHTALSMHLVCMLMGAHHPHPAAVECGLVTAKLSSCNVGDMHMVAFSLVNSGIMTATGRPCPCTHSAPHIVGWLVVAAQALACISRIQSNVTLGCVKSPGYQHDLLDNPWLMVSNQSPLPVQPVGEYADNA